MATSPLNARLADQHRHRENRGRLAHAYARFMTTGVGSFEFEDRIDFETIFLERPFIAIGHQLDAQAFTMTYEDEDGDEDYLDLPQCTGYVTEWDQSSHDHYIGCWVAVVVQLDVEMAEVPTIYHDFTFSAIAIKDVPTTA